VTFFIRLSFLSAVIVFCLNPLAVIAQSSDSPQIAIIIDDVGNDPYLGLDILELPGHITISVLPEAPYARDFAQLATEFGKTVMVHVPMQPVDSEKITASFLTASQSKEEFLQKLDVFLKQFPQAVAINNHMGSYLTSQKQQMDWLMAALFARNLAFIDSRTTESSVTRQAASDYQLYYGQRDVFLDNDKSTQAMHLQFEKLLAIAKQKGKAIAIAHPYPETITFLKNRLAELEKSRQFRMVSVSNVLQRSID